MKNILSIVLAAMLCCLSGTVFADQLSEGFEGETFAPEGWTAINASGSAVWARTTAQKQSGSASAWVNNGTYAGDNYLITPKLAPESGEKLQFYIKINESAKTTALKIEISETTPEAASFTTTLITYESYTKATNPITTSWALKSIDLSSYVGKEIYVAFHAVNSGSYGAANLYLDAVAGVTLATEDEGGDCPNPKSLSISNQVFNGATFTWAQNADETTYQWACVAKDADVASWNNLAANVRTVTVDGLTPGTSYDFYVRSVCESEQSTGVKKNFTPDYVAPSDVTVASITSSSATVTWTANSGETAWTLQYKKSADSGWTDVAVATNATHTLTGLAAATAYQVRIVAGTKTSAAQSFTTACGAVKLPFEEAFTAIGCWTKQDCASGTGISSGTFMFSYNSNPPQYLISPEIEAIAKPVMVEFEYKARSATYPETFKVGYSTTTDDVATAFKWSDEVTSTNTTMLTYSAQLPAGVKYISIQYTANNQYALYIDNLSVKEAPACAAPTALAASEVGAKTAKLTWTSDAENFKVQYTTNKENWGEEHAVAAKTLALTGLTPAAKYYARVKAVCSDTESSDYCTEIEFTTECEVASMPFEESFAGGELPACWSATSQWTYYGYETFSMRYTSSANGDLTLPAIALDDDAQLTFWRQSNYVSCSVYANSVSEENKLAEFAKTGEKWAESVVDLSAYKGQTVTLIIRGNYYSGSKYLYIDDVAVTYKPVDAPAALAAEAADGGASITWAAAEGVTWNLQYRAQGDESWKEVSGLTTNTYALEGLVNGVTYEVRVQAVASANRKSDWTAPAAFTPENCPSVTEITYGAKTYNSIVINWTTSGAGTWNLRYQQGELGWNSPITNLSEASYTLTALTAGIPYSVQVKPSCGNDNTWVDGEAFTLGYTKPADVAVSDITDAQATATWAAVADAPNGYIYAVVLKDATVDWNEARATNDLSVSLIGLEALTDYDLHVAAVYGDHLEAAAAVNFTTVAIAPKNLAQEGESTTSAATFTWEANGAAEKWQWSIDGENWSEPISELTATADELNAGTAYTFYVRSYYAEGKFSSAISLDFSTECAVVTLPFAQDFGTVDGTKPTCWTIANWGTSANSWYTYTDYAKTGYALRYNARTLSSADAVTPSIEITDAAELKFYIKNSVGNNSAKVECKVLVNDGTETTELADITTRYTAATLQTIDMSAFAGKTVTIIFRGVGYDTSGSPYLWIDDVTVTFKAVAVPTSLHTAATDGGATVVWGSEEGTSWNLRYREVAEQEGDWTLVEGLTEKSTELTGLTNGTTYEVQVQAVASANRKSEWTESVEFAPVACAAVTKVTFGAATYNSVVVNWTTTGIGLWDVRYKAGDGEWTEVKNIEELTTTLTDLTTNAVYSVEVKAACSDDAWVAAEAFTPVYTKPANVAVSDITDIIATATWDAVADAPNGYKYIVVLKDATVDWNDAKATDELDVPLIGLNALTAYDLHVAAVYGDHLEAAAAVSFTTIAFAPTNLAQVGESTTSAATFAWEAQGAATQWQWSLDGENWSEPISVLTATADELNAGTAYTFYVRSYYDNEAVSEAISLAFTTECAVVALPFAEDFEAEGLPVCWASDDWSATVAAGKWARDNSYSRSGYAIRFNAKTNASATITTPAIRLGDEDAVQLTFFIRNSYGSTPNYISGKVTVVDIDDADNKVEAEFINAKADNLEEQTVDLAALLGKIVTVTFTANGVGTSTNASLYIDDVKVDVKPIVPAAIDNTVAVDKARKLIENDQVVIIRNGVKYNAQGVVVK